MMAASQRSLGGSHTCTFDSSGLTVQNGGFRIINSDGDEVMRISSDGFVELRDLQFYGDLEQDSFFVNALANINKISVANLSVGGSLIIDEHDFYIYKSGEGGYDLKSYIDARLSDWKLI
jgi:hypothetical protein